jgi:hypothetical protein
LILVKPASRHEPTGLATRIDMAMLICTAMRLLTASESNALIGFFAERQWLWPALINEARFHARPSHASACRSPI